MEKYGADNVYAFRKSRIYLRLKVWPNILFALLLLWGIIYAFVSVYDSRFSPRHIIGVIFCILIVILLQIGTLKKYLDYKCDFLIITPADIIIFNQLWPFKRNIQSIAWEKINSVTTQRAWFLLNIFNVWTLTIHLQWGYMASEVNIPYIHQPDRTRQNIMKIIAKPNEVE